MIWWIWLLLGFLLLALELLTPGGFYLLFFGVAAIGVGLLSAAIDIPLWIQWLLFSALALVSVMFFRRPLLARLHRGQSTHEVDSMVGETALTLEEIAANAIGKAELRGSTWTARNVGDQPLARSQRCSVERVEGLMLWIRAQ
jgi:membrane protein implicated in regulation of membrane protease activity